MYENNPEYYLISAKSDEHRESIISNFSESFCVKNIISKDELEFFTRAAFQSQPNISVLQNGMCLMDGNLYDLFLTLKDRISDFLGESVKTCPAVGGHFVLQPCGARVHSDGVKEKAWYNSPQEIDEYHPQRRYTSWKSILIPLWCHGEMNKGGHIVFFDQRANSFAHAYNSGSSYYKPVTNEETEYLDINGNTVDLEKERIDQDLYQKYIDKSYDHVKRFSIENVFEWCPGDMLVFDSTQLHVSNQKNPEKKPYYSNKMGFLITLIKETD
jgi:hypothetical protein